MSSWKWSPKVKSENIEEGFDMEGKEKKEKIRKLSLQESFTTLRLDGYLSSDLSSENKRFYSENEKSGNQFGYSSISDGELTQNLTEYNRKRSKRRKHSLFKPGHRRVKSLSKFEVNKYTISDIKKLHERLAVGQPELRPKPSFLKTFTKKQKLALICICLTDFTNFCSISINTPFFPKESRRKGMSQTTLGVLCSFYAFVMLVTSPLLGKILPQVGPKFLLLMGIFLAGASEILFGFLIHIKEDWVFTVYCFLLEGLLALGMSAYCAACYVFVAEIFPSNVGAVLGLTETFVGLGLSIGPAFGGFLYHIGGYELPFLVIGTILFTTIPITFCCLPIIQGGNVESKSGSFFEVISEPYVIIIGLVVVITSNIWAFLDPTLEPHLQQFNLTPEKVGLIFFLFSALYGITSPFWGYVSDKTDNHWFMITAGLMFSTIGLLLLGPAPFIPFLKSELWLNLVALSILGTSIALSLLPTFQGLLNSVSQARGCTDENDMKTHSIVAGAWSSLYALGEIIGPLLGGVITENYGFSTCCTVMAAGTFTLAIGSFIYFVVRDCLEERGENYRYKFDDSDESDYVNSSDDLESRSILQPDYRTKLYVEEEHF